MQGQLCVPHLLPLALVMLCYPSVELCVGLLQLQKERGCVPGKIQVDEAIPPGITEAKAPGSRTTHTHPLGWWIREGPWDGGGVDAHLPAASLVLLGQLLHGFSGPVTTKRYQGPL